ncbi:hypothetical protein AC481_02750 [miscellaneous Crenarchaeota group archaeon SMTZ-80]|nr:MAG: hypothetical protein AC481_02750 [miscellaneous Crenarchaeota group archaeon SMTZ-80]
MSINKRGIRSLGISESFIKNIGGKSILAGVVVRADRIIDGFGLSLTTIGGMDATENIISLYKALKRRDINVIFLNGCVISWFNIIDLNEVYKKLDVPLICITYEESEGLKKYLKEYFKKDWEDRYKIYLKNGSREKIILNTRKAIFVRNLGMELPQAERLLNKFTIQGAIPEPLRISRLLARSILKSKLSQKIN